LEQLCGGRPGSEVIRQQAVKSRAKLKRPKAKKNANPKKAMLKRIHLSDLGII
jgi:hypothetical protein